MLDVSSEDNTRSDGGQAADGAAKREERSRLARSSHPYLLGGEEVLFDARPAWTAWFKELAFAVAIALVGLITGEPSAIGTATLVALSVVGYVAYQRMKVRYLVTDRRIVVATGISSSATNEAWLVDVRGMQTGASLLERLLGHGHICVSTSIVPRGSLLSFANLGGMTLGGISDYQRIAAVVRRRQAEVKNQSR